MGGRDERLGACELRVSIQLSEGTMLRHSHCRQNTDTANKLVCAHSLVRGVQKWRLRHATDSTLPETSTFCQGKKEEMILQFEGRKAERKESSSQNSVSS